MPALASDPLWLKNFYADLGVREVAGPGSNPRIVEMYAKAGHPEIRDDAVAWCSAAMNAEMVDAGEEPTDSLMARSWLKWGIPLETKKKLPRGAVCVFSRGSDPSQGHVACLVEDQGDALLVIGGNQANSISIIRMPRSRLLGARWSNIEPLPAGVISTVVQKINPLASAPTEPSDAKVPESKKTTPINPAPHIPAGTIGIGSKGWRVKAYQQKLNEIGGAYYVGDPDGDFGVNTRNATMALQADSGLPVTGIVDEATERALDVALPPPVSEKRAEATVKDLREKGSETITFTDKLKGWGKWLFGGGLFMGADQTGALDKAKQVTDKFGGVHETIDILQRGVQFFVNYAWVIVLLAGAGFIYYSVRIAWKRLKEHQDGTNLKL